MVNSRDDLDLMPLSGSGSELVEWRIASSPVPYPDAVAEMEARVPSVSVGEAVMRMEIAGAPMLVFRNENIRPANTWDEFVKLLDEKGGFISAHWDGTAETEEKIKEQTKATIRCIPLNNKQESGACILTGKPSTQRVLFARAY